MLSISVRQESYFFRLIRISFAARHKNLKKCRMYFYCIQQRNCFMLKNAKEHPTMAREILRFSVVTFEHGQAK